MAQLFETQEIRSGTALEALAIQWKSLWTRCPNASPFQHPDWLIPWWRHFGSDKQMCALALYANGTLVGVAPLCIYQEGTQRKLMPLGIGLSDYLDFLFAPGFEQDGTRAVCEHLARTVSAWDRGDLEPLLGDSPLLKTPFPEPINTRVETVDQITALELPDKWNDFKVRLSRHFRDRINDAHRRAAKLGDVCFQTATAESFEECFNHILRFHRTRWGNHSESAGNPADRFHQEAALGMLRRGELRLYSLKIGSQTIAVLYGFEHRARGFLYMSGYDPAFSKLSPGVLLITHALEEMVGEGVRECEFLRGREPYKYRWGVIERTTYALRVEHHNRPVSRVDAIKLER